MALPREQKAPFPWFGGKSKAAPLVWDLLGDVAHYCEPFAGSLAVLLQRPHLCNRHYYSETVNDRDGFIVNAWRAIQWAPEEVAYHASWPASEADKVARQIACLKWRTDEMLELLMGSADFYDARIAGWWLYAVACQIGAFTGDGPWTVDPATGRIFKQGKGKAREPGVSRNRPHLGDNGQGVCHAGLREPSVGAEDDQEILYHPITMPKLTEWMQLLSARLRHVRILNGDWQRLCTTGAMHTIPVRQGKGVCGVFLDPPYDNNERADGLYSHDDGSVAADVRAWCIKNGDNTKNRIVLAGYDTEHEDLERHGWTVHEWFANGFLTGGYGNIAKGVESGDHQQHRERLWASPHCLKPAGEEQQSSDQLSLLA